VFIMWHPRGMSRLLASVAGLASACALGLMNATPASAAPTCTPAPVLGATVTCTFSSGGFTELTVPDGVFAVSLDVAGGGGGRNSTLSDGGSGALVRATVDVRPGQTLRVWVGGGGGMGTGGGGLGFGNGGSPAGSFGGAGGGSSAVLLDGIVVVVAGAGGGGGSNSLGAGLGTGGSSLQDGSSGGLGCLAPDAGGGGANGVGGTSWVGETGGAGFNGSGGASLAGLGSAPSAAGAGGAGFGGGGAGSRGFCAAAGGGGAGGSYSIGSATFTSAGNAGTSATGGSGGNGYVRLAFTNSRGSAAPPDLHQGVGQPAAGCAAVDRPDLDWAGVSSGGWGASWAQWLNSGAGGPVCVRVLRFSTVSQKWTVVSSP
jgi:hypothetical protein